MKKANQSSGWLSEHHFAQTGPLCYNPRQQPGRAGRAASHTRAHQACPGRNAGAGFLSVAPTPSPNKRTFDLNRQPGQVADRVPDELRRYRNLAVNSNNVKGDSHMGAVPKIRISKSRRKKRRSHHALKLKNLVRCPQCHEKKLPHHICLSCGYYHGIQVIEVQSR